LFEACEIKCNADIFIEFRGSEMWISHMYAVNTLHTSVLDLRFPCWWLWRYVFWVVTSYNSEGAQRFGGKYCDVLPKSLKAGISDTAVFTRQRTSVYRTTHLVEAFPLQRNCWTRCCLISPPRGYLRESIRSQR
jgi:hypothetical protein